MEIEKLIREAVEANGRLHLTVEGDDVRLDMDGIFAKPDNPVKTGLVCSYMANMVNEVMERILDIDAIGLSRQCGDEGGHGAIVDFLADLCKLMKADCSPKTAVERLFTGWYRDYTNAAERLDKALRENEALKVQCQTLEEALSIFGEKEECKCCSAKITTNAT